MVQLEGRLSVCSGRASCLLDAERARRSTDWATSALPPGTPLLSICPWLGRTAGPTWPAASVPQCGCWWESPRRRMKPKTGVRYWSFSKHLYTLRVHKLELVWRFLFISPSEEVNPAAAEPHHGTCLPGMRSVDEGLIHILSMGSKALMLQVWANFSTGSLTFRWFSV